MKSSAAAMLALSSFSSMRENRFSYACCKREIDDGMMLTFSSRTSLCFDIMVASVFGDKAVHHSLQLDGFCLVHLELLCAPLADSSLNLDVLQQGLVRAE